jgi:5-methylcytosine-specific restriction endonuclease McrA
MRRKRQAHCPACDGYREPDGKEYCPACLERRAAELEEWKRVHGNGPLATYNGPWPRTDLERRRGRAAAATRKHRVGVFERDGHRCQICGSTENLVLDHIVPIAKGGGDEPSNLQALCWSCNSRKGAR